MKRFICVVLSITMLLCTLGYQASACEFESVQPKSVELMSICDFFRMIYGKLFELFNPGFIYVEVDEYTDELFEIPGLDSEFIPQGVCFVESLNSFAISGYMPKDKDGNERNSRIYLVDADTNEAKMFEIDSFTGHAGGIASNGDDIWVSSGGSQSSNGTVYHLSANYLASKESGSVVTFDGKFKVETKGSFLYCDSNTLWVGEFYNDDKDSNKVNESHYYGKNHSLACGYNLPLNVDYSANEKLAPDIVLSIPDKVQGMATTPDGKVIFSSSYGRRNDSTLYVFEPFKNWESTTITIFGKENIPLYVSSKDSTVCKIKMPTLMEGIDYHNDKLYIIFESGAIEYSNAKKIIKNLWETDINSIIN